MKQLITTMMIVALLGQTFSRLWIVADFYANRDYIARVLCVNKDRPMLHCGGLCQLKKRLDKDEKQDKDVPGRKSGSQNEVVSSQSFFCVAPLVSFSDERSVRLPLSIGVVIDRSLSIFHPPPFSC